MDNEPDVEISIYLYLTPKFEGGENNYDYLTSNIYAILVDTVKHQNTAISNPSLNDGDIKKIKKIIQDVITQWYSDLSELFSASLQQIAINMFAHGLISQSVKDAPIFINMMTEFQSGMKFIRDIKRLVKHCQMFLDVVVKQGGPFKQAAISIAADWTGSIKKEMDINLEFDTKW